MARSTFGGYGGDQVSLDPASNAGFYKAAANYGAVGTFWSASTGGTQYTDLIDPTTSVALAGVSTDAHGHVIPFKGPDGITEGWLDFGGGRFKVTAIDPGLFQLAGGSPVSGATYSKVKTDGTDQTSQLQAELTALINGNGGCLILPAGIITVNGKITLPTTGSISSGALTQPPIIIKGQGGWFSGQNTLAVGGTRLRMLYQGTGTPVDSKDAKFVTYGLGSLTFEDLTLEDTTSGSTTPFVYTTATTIHTNRIAVTGGTTTPTSVAQDAFILGGTTAAGSTGYGDVNAPFQGYGTIIGNSYFKNIRRAVYGRTYANQVVVRDNFFDKGCGSNLAGGACVEFDGGLGGGTGQCANDIITGNYFENTGYVYGIKLRAGQWCYIAGNGFEDSGTNWVAGVRLEDGDNGAHSVLNTLIGNLDSTGVLLSEDAGALNGNLILAAGGAAADTTKLIGNISIYPNNATSLGSVSWRTGSSLTFVSYAKLVVPTPSSASVFYVTDGTTNWGELSQTAGGTWYFRAPVIAGGSAGSVTLGDGSNTGATLTLNPGSTGTSSIQYKHAGTNSWLLYDANSTSLFLRDSVNGVMAVTISPGATNTGSASFSGSVIAGRWIKAQGVANASLPAASTAGSGAQMFDTTANKPVFSNGTTWRDARGYTTLLATKTANYTHVDGDEIIVYNGTSLTATLPDPTTVVVGKRWTLKNINASALTVVSAGTTKTLDGAASQSLAQWAKAEYVSDGTQWLTV